LVRKGYRLDYHSALRPYVTIVIADSLAIMQIPAIVNLPLKKKHLHFNFTIFVARTTTTAIRATFNANLHVLVAAIAAQVSHS